MNISMLDPTSLIPFEGNSKLHPEEQVAAIASSIKNFGFDQPVVADQNLVIIKGHGRTLAAISLGLKHIPVVIKNVSDADARLNRVLDNHLVSQEYDSFSLREDLLALQKAGFLQKSLFDEKTIPEVYTAVSRVEASLFSLVAKHVCKQCSYRW